MRKGAGRAIAVSLLAMLSSLALCAWAWWRHDLACRSLREARQAWAQAGHDLRQARDLAGMVDDLLPLHRRMEEQGLYAPADRLGLLERIGRLRQEHSLFPVQVEIGAEKPVPLSSPGGPGAGSVFLASRLLLSLSLLHEGDMLCLYQGMQGAGGLLLPEYLAVEVLAAGLAGGDGRARENLRATCRFVWLSVAAAEEEP